MLTFKNVKRICFKNILTFTRQELQNTHKTLPWVSNYFPPWFQGAFLDTSPSVRNSLSRKFFLDRSNRGGGINLTPTVRQPNSKKSELFSIVKKLKDTKMKVQAQIQEDQVRVTGKKRDDLQQVMALLREEEVGAPLQFTNFRD